MYEHCTYSLLLCMRTCACSISALATTGLPSHNAVAAAVTQTVVYKAQQQPQQLLQALHQLQRTTAQCTLHRCCYHQL
jgi:hypothetical protein